MIKHPSSTAIVIRSWIHAAGHSHRRMPLALPLCQGAARPGPRAADRAEVPRALLPALGARLATMTPTAIDTSASSVKLASAKATVTSLGKQGKTSSRHLLHDTTSAVPYMAPHPDARINRRRHRARVGFRPTSRRRACLAASGALRQGRLWRVRFTPSAEHAHHTSPPHGMRDDLMRRPTRLLPAPPSPRDARRLAQASHG